MNNTDQIKVFLSMLLMQMPTLIVCVGACVVILTRWKEAPRGAFWALLGFGIVLVLGIAMPIVQTTLQSWVFQGGQRAERMRVFSTFSVIWSVLHAVTYGFLLVAVFAGRPNPDAIQPPRLDRQGEQ